MQKAGRANTVTFWQTVDFSAGTSTVLCRTLTRQVLEVFCAGAGIKVGYEPNDPLSDMFITLSVPAAKAFARRLLGLIGPKEMGTVDCPSLRVAEFFAELGFETEVI